MLLPTHGVLEWQGCFFSFFVEEGCYLPPSRPNKIASQPQIFLFFSGGELSLVFVKHSCRILPVVNQPAISSSIGNWKKHETEIRINT